MSDPSDYSQPVPEPANLRFLRRLVTTLMVVMIGGLLVIVALFVIRFSSGSSDSLTIVLPDNITLPDGTKPQNFTVGPDWYAIVTQDNTILIFDRSTKALHQTITIKPFE